MTNCEKNRERYKKAFDVLAASEKISLEVDQMKNKKQKSNYKKSVAAAVAALVFVMAAGSGVYAAARHCTWKPLIVLVKRCME